MANFALEALHRAPVERRLEVAARGAAAAEHRVALGDVAFASAVDRGIDRQAEPRIAMSSGTGDMVVNPGIVAAHIELEDAQRIGRSRRDLLQARLAHRAQHVGDAELARRSRDRGRRAAMEAFERADRRQHNGQPQPPPERRH